MLLLCNPSFGTAAGLDPVGIRRFWVESRHAWVADGPRSLARAAGLPEDVVEATVHAFNEAVSAGGDDPLTGRDSPVSAGGTVRSPRFPLAHKNLGGVRAGSTAR